MERQQVLELYDEAYAAAYEERFIFDEQYQHVARFEIEVLDQLLRASGNWLDVACGTGYFLRQFPGVARAGFDLSTAMLEVARAKNPDALFLLEGDFRNDHPEWEGQWDLVSCMWCAYCYVESMTEIDRVIGNLTRWTSDNGVCFLPLCDLEDVVYGRETLRYCNPDIQIFGGPCYVNAVVWSYVDERHDKRHENLISPHIEYLMGLFRESFSRVEIIYYPPHPRPIPGQRKALIATGKRGTTSAEMNNALREILQRSQEHLRNVLTMADLQAAQANPSMIQGTRPLDSGKAGWLRRLWRRCPARFRREVRGLLGES